MLVFVDRMSLFSLFVEIKTMLFRSYEGQVQRGNCCCLPLHCLQVSINNLIGFSLKKNVTNSHSILILESPSSQAGGSAQDFQRDCCSVHREQEGHWSLLQDHPQVARGHQSRARRQRRLHVQVLRPPRAHQGDPKGCHVDCEKGERSGADRGEVSSFGISCLNLHGKPGEL